MKDHDKVEAPAFEGYVQVESDVESMSLDSEGDFVKGLYEGIDERKIKDGVAEYLVIRIEGAGLKGIPINDSLKRAVKKLHEGQHIIVELQENIAQQGRPQPFKKYRVFTKSQE